MEWKTRRSEGALGHDRARVGRLAVWDYYFGPRECRVAFRPAPNLLSFSTLCSNFVFVTIVSVVF